MYFSVNKIIEKSEFGEWNKCGTQFNYDNIDIYYLTPELADERCNASNLVWDDPKYNEKSNCLNILEEEIKEKRLSDLFNECGEMPKMPLSELRYNSMRIKNFFFDNSLGMILWIFGAYLPAILLIVIGYFIGYYLDKRK